MNSCRLHWETRRQSFKFTLGDFLLAEFSFDAEVLEAPLSWYFIEGNRSATAIAEVNVKSKTYVIRSFPISGSLPRLSRTATHIRYIPRQYDRHFIELRGSFQDYLAKHSAKSRKNLARQVRTLANAARGELAVREYRSTTEMRQFHRLAIELSLSTYQQRLFNEGLASYVVSEDELALLAEADGVRGYMLFLSEKPIAYVYAPCFPGTLLYQLIGYDPSYQKYSPGTVLLYLLIQRLFSEQEFEYMDFGEGYSWYKNFFSTGSSRCARVYYLAQTPGNFVAIALHIFWNSLTDSIGWALARLRVRSKLRTLLRARGTRKQLT